MWAVVWVWGWGLPWRATGGVHRGTGHLFRSNLDRNETCGRRTGSGLVGQGEECTCTCTRTCACACIVCFCRVVCASVCRVSFILVVPELWVLRAAKAAPRCWSRQLPHIGKRLVALEAQRNAHVDTPSPRKHAAGAVLPSEHIMSVTVHSLSSSPRTSIRNRSCAPERLIRATAVGHDCVM